MNFALLFDHTVTESRDRTAADHGTEPSRSYRELRERVAALAGGVTGLAAGSRWSWATVRSTSGFSSPRGGAGLAVVSVNAKLHPGEVDWIFQDSGARLVGADQAHVAGPRGVNDTDRPR